MSKSKVIERNGMTLARPPVINLAKPKIKPVAKVDPCTQVLEGLLAYGEANEVTLTENLPYDRLHILLAYPEHFQHGKPDNKCWQLDYIIPKYLYRKNRSPDGAVQVTYREKAHGIGRHLTYDSNDMHLCASFGFTRHARNFMYHDTGVDIDMENCSGRLFEYLLTVCNLPHPNISKYVSERRSILQELQRQYNITRDQAKRLSIGISYGGKVKSWMEKVGTDKHPGEMWDGIVDEIGSLIPKFKKLGIWDKCPVSEKKLEDAAEPEIDPNETEMQVHTRDLDAEEALKRSRVSYIMQHLEKRVLMVAYRVCLENGVKPLALCYDGLIVDRASLPAVGLEGLLAMIKERVSSEFPGLTMPFENKPMECPEMPSGFNKRSFDAEKHCFNPVFMKGLDFILDPRIDELQKAYNEKKQIYLSFNSGKTKAMAKEEMKTISDQIEEVKKECKLQVYLRQRAYFESFHSMCESPIVYFRKQLDTGQLPTVYSESEFKSLNSSEREFVIGWLADPHRIRFKRIDFLPRPLPCPHDVLNTFRGFAIEQTPSPPPGSVDLSFVLEHINFLCNGEKPVSKYLLYYLAHLVQFPGIAPGVAIVLLSKIQGVGKNKFLDNFCNTVIGSKFCFLNGKMDQIATRFTSAANKLVVLLDEVEQKSKLSYDSELKNLITASVIQWEKKGKDIIEVNNSVRYIITSNKTCPVNVEDSDRRYCIIGCNAKERISEEYSSKLIKLMTDKPTMRAFYDYLMSIDLSDWNIRNIPETEYKRTAKELSRHPVHSFIEDFTETHIIPHILDPEVALNEEIYSVKEGVVTVNSTFLHELYRQKMAEWDLKTKGSNKFFANLMKDNLDADYKQITLSNKQRASVAVFSVKQIIDKFLS